MEWEVTSNIRDIPPEFKQKKKKGEREGVQGKGKRKRKMMLFRNFHTVLAQTKIDRKTHGSVLQKYLYEKRERERERERENSKKGWIQRRKSKNQRCLHYYATVNRKKWNKRAAIALKSRSRFLVKRSWTNREPSSSEFELRHAEQNEIRSDEAVIHRQQRRVN